MPLQGTFDVLDFTEVLRLLARYQLTGRLHVRHRSFAANLFLEEGQLTGADQSEHQTAAAIGDVRGRLEEVCFEMLEADRGTFEFLPGKPSSLPVTSRFLVDAVLTQARRRLDEWRELQETIPSLDLQPRLVLDLETAEVTIDRQRWRLLTAIDGRRNLRAVGRVLNLSDFDVCRVVRGLMADGIVELDGLAALSATTRDTVPVVPTLDIATIERGSAIERVSIRVAAREVDPTGSDPGGADPGIRILGPGDVARLAADGDVAGPDDDAQGTGAAGPGVSGPVSAEPVGVLAEPAADAADDGLAPAPAEPAAVLVADPPTGDTDADTGRRRARRLRLRARAGAGPGAHPPEGP